MSVQLSLKPRCPLHQLTPLMSQSAQAKTSQTSSSMIFDRRCQEEKEKSREKVHSGFVYVFFAAYTPRNGKINSFSEWENGTLVRSICTYRNPHQLVLSEKSCASGGKRSVIGFSILTIQRSVPPRPLSKTKHDEVRNYFSGAAGFSAVPSGWRRAQSYGR